jgi:hypothetical protein
MKSVYVLLFSVLGLFGCATEQVEVVEEISAEPAYGSDDQRFLDNVRIKQSDENGITYEYKDVRIDEIAYLASEYCFEQGEKKAFLHDSQLYRNFSRRATFHCL